MKDFGLMDLKFPLRGLHTGTSFEDQPPGTTRSCLNVVGYEPVTGADRGGRRYGLTKYMGTQLHPNGPLPIQDINHLATSVGVPVANPGDFVVPLSSGGSYKIFDNTATVTATAGTAGDTFNCACWDGSGNVYVAYLDASSNIKVLKVNRTGTVAWTTTLATSVGSAPHGAFGICWDNNNYIYVLGTGASLSPVLRIWKVAVADGAISGGTYLISGASVAALRDQSNAQPSLNVLAFCSGYLCYPTAAQQVTVYKISDATITNISLTAARFGTAITDIATDSNSFFYVNGFNSTGPHTGIAKISVTGTTLYDLEPGDFIYSICYNSSVQELGGVNTTKFYTLSLLTGNILGLSATTGTAFAVVRNSGIGGFSVYSRAATNNYIQFGTGLTPTIAAFTLVANNINAGVQVNQQTPVTTTSQVNIRALGVAGGLIRRFNSSGPVTVVNGGLISGGRIFVFSTPVFDKMYFFDGLSIALYDAATDSCSYLVASAGTLPKDNSGNFPRLCCTWRQRLVVSGLLNDGANWFMSAVGDPTNWNYNPIPTVETQAVAGNNSTAGVCPDIINALVPYSDEILIFGLDHSLFQMTGDPMAGGRIDLISDGIGMAFGQPFCRDGTGTLYFMSSRGSIYKFAPGAIPERISDPISEQLLGAIDFSNTLVRMAWDERQMSFHVFVSPTAGGATTNYTYDVRNRAWWPFSFGNTQHQPFAIHSLQGFTVTDRNVLLGGQDGYIRYLDPAAVDDDGTAINSYVFIGPLRGKGDLPAYMTDLQCVLGATSGNATWTLYGGISAQTALTRTTGFSGTFSAGRNRSQSVRSCNHAMYVKLGANNNTPWQLESLRAILKLPTGKTRQRLF